MYDNEYSDDELAVAYGGDTDASQQQIAEEMPELKHGNGIEENKEILEQKEAKLPEYENCFVSVEGLCGLYDDGEKQSFNECIEDITSDHVDALIKGKHVLICDTDGKCIAECSISEDNNLDVNFYKLDRVERFELAHDVVERIEESRNQIEEIKEWSNNKEIYMGYDDESYDEDDLDI